MIPSIERNSRGFLRFSKDVVRGTSMPIPKSELEEPSLISLSGGSLLCQLRGQETHHFAETGTFCPSIEHEAGGEQARLSPSLPDGSRL